MTAARRYAAFFAPVARFGRVAYPYLVGVLTLAARASPANGGYAAVLARLLILAIVALEQPVAAWMLFQDWPAAP
jgi:hypothetical protein